MPNIILNVLNKYLFNILDYNIGKYFLTYLTNIEIDLNYYYLHYHGSFLINTAKTVLSDIITVIIFHLVIAVPALLKGVDDL